MLQTCSYSVNSPGYVKEQLKEKLKSQNEENRNCVLTFVQSISYFSVKALIALRKGKQDEESTFKQLLLADMIKCFEIGLKSLVTSI